MKTVIVMLLALTAWIVVYGSPFTADRPESKRFFGSPVPILPMTFAHVDHGTVSCVECHHNYVDDTGIEPCMYCHVTHTDVSALLEEQFHSLCRGCHEDRAAGGEAGGPPRQCVACHLADELF